MGRVAHTLETPYLVLQCTDEVLAKSFDFDVQQHP